MATYNGIEVFFPTVNWETQPKLNYKRTGDKLDTKTGKWGYDDHTGLPRLEPQFTLWLNGRAAVLGLLAWAEARRGKAVPFWMPSYRIDLTVNSAGTAGDGGLLINDTGYVLRQFPLINRRDVMLCTWSALSADMVYHVTAASTTGGRSSLTFAENLRVNVPASTPIMFFHLFRLADDRVTVKWLSRTLAECTLSVTELSAEYPE